MRGYGRRGITALAAAGLLTASATADAAIVINKSVDGVALGNTQAQVIAHWGKPKLSRTDLRQEGGSRGETVLFFKKSKYGQDDVTLYKGRVAGIATYSTAQKTSNGIGPGTPYTMVKKVYPGAFSPLYGAFFAVFPSVKVKPAVAAKAKFTTVVGGKSKYWSPVDGTAFTLIHGSKGGSTDSITIGKWGPYCFWSFNCGVGG